VNIVKGIGSILAGFIFIVLSHTGTDFVLEKLGIFPPPAQGFHVTWMVVTATVYRSIYTVIGGYITAVLAPEPRMRYVIILGSIGLVVGTLAAIATIPMKLGPAWYPIALAVLALPSVWLGGQLRTRQ
jgi:hypothetical protein